MIKWWMEERNHGLRVLVYTFVIFFTMAFTLIKLEEKYQWNKKTFIQNRLEWGLYGSLKNGHGR